MLQRKKIEIFTKLTFLLDELNSIQNNHPKVILAYCHLR